jgi:cyclophilin family peptidyl-prolyl cis-trans isomerase
MYAARAAAVLGDTGTLIALAADGVPNVRTEAVAGLSRVAGHAADSVYIAALSAGDYQLVLTAAQALRGTPRSGAVVPALERSLARITAQRRETSRDPRIALLATLRDVGSGQLAESLLPYRVDFDSVVADSAAAMVSVWTGRTYRSEPRPLPAVDGAPENMAALRAARVRVTMAPGSGGGSFELRLFPDDAPITVGRFLRLVRSGYYDGLTLHRVVPNFVVQGGSPGANEYVGDGPFLRDEVGLRSHRRGAVGISTRGRNTGDAQFFIDLVDLPRLDHDYTVFAEVESGMATVDQLLEGDVMAKVEIITQR